jgi:hypothetical protein
MQVVKKGDPFLIHVLSAQDPMTQHHEIFLLVSKGYVLEKNNVDTLFKHWPYDCVTNLEQVMQLPFGPIYNKLQNELVALQECIKENLEKSSFDIQNL